MARTVRTLLGLALLLAAGCSSFAVEHDYDPQADFARYRSWYWLPPSPSGDPRADNALVDARVRAAVENALAARGFTQTSTGEGDLGIGYHIAIEGKLDVRTIDHYYGYGPGWGYYGGPGRVGSETYVDQYDEGTLILDLVDSRSRKLVWRGSASARLREGLTPQEREERTQEAVDAILNQYPPK